MGNGICELSHADTIYSPDYEGVYTPFGPDEPVWQEGRSNRPAGKFNGTADYIELQRVDPQNFVVEFDIIYDSRGDNTRFFSQAFDGTADPYLSSAFSIGTFSDNVLRVANGSGEVSGPELIPGTKYHIKLEGTSTNYRSYLDGTLIGDQNAVSKTSTTQPAYLSSQKGETGGRNYWCKGTISNLIIDGVLIPIDEGSGTEIHDSEGNIVGTLYTSDEDTFWTGRIKNEDGNTYAIDYDGAILDPLPSLKYQPAAENLCPNGTLETAQTVTLANTGKYTFAVFGPVGADATIAADTAVGTGFGTATPGNPIEIDITTAGDVTVTGTQPEAINLLEMEFAAGKDIGPIYTNGATDSTDRTVYAYDQGNFSNDSMSLYCEVKPQGDEKIIGNFLNYDGTDFSLVDYGGNSANLPGITDDWNKIGIAVNSAESLMAICVDGIWSADVPYSGQIEDLSQAVELFIENKYPGQIRRIVTYIGGSLNELKSEIDKLMASTPA